MLERERLESKKISKTNAVTSMMDYELAEGDIHVGPSDYVPWLKDRKWCHIRIEGTTFGDVPLNAELKLEVWDSPNSAGVIIDAIRCLRIGLDRGLSGTLVAPSSYFMKSPAHPDPRRHRAPARRGVHPGRGQRDARRQRGVEEGLQGAREPGEGEGRRQVTQGRKLEAPHRRLESTPPRIVERAAIVGYRSTATLLAHVPPALSRAVIATASQASYLAWPAKRRFSNANFAKVLGLPPGHPRVRRLALRAYKEYARYMVELMRLPSRPREELVAGIEGDGVERGRAGVARLGAGDDRRRRPRGQQRGGRRRDRRGAATRPTSSPTTRRSPSCSSCSASSASRGASTSSRGATCGSCYSVLRRKEILALLVDWGYRPDGVPVRLFGAWTTLPAGPATLAAKTGAIIAPLAIRRTPHGTLRIEGHEVFTVAVLRPRGHPARHPADRRLPRGHRSGPRRSSGTASSRCGPTRRGGPRARGARRRDARRPPDVAPAPRDVPRAVGAAVPEPSARPPGAAAS